MKLELDSMQGGLSVENTPRCKIFRHIYKWGDAISRSLLRIYEFKKRTIVIASDLNRCVIWDEYLIEKVVQDFKLNTDNLFWISHVGLFSMGMYPKEDFLHTIINWPKKFKFQQAKCELITTISIDLEEVEKLIEHRLEPVETWLGLDLMIQAERKEKHQEKIQKLLYHYLQEQLVFLSQHIKIQKILSQTLIGAFFFYPEQQENNEECIKFLGCTDLEQSNDKCELLALSYIPKYYPDKEIIICVCIEDIYCYCTILSQQAFLMPT